ncbi:RDD family protein [Draconibacterium halophilum]|uniref:RDD family protein n=1 Tax=Draconibacterium halophilum TaxID=2706887 RepID=A0A6C0RFR4_9BACT|nr:RDD family protein [Draconibacterium halophilum]QIA08816.1 RDD family protein [Draconibacterium halophilum]
MILNKIPVINTTLQPNVSRFLAYIIDWLLILVIGWIFSSFMLILWFPVEIFLIAFAYRLIFESSTDTTIGKRLFGLSIQQNNDSDISFKSILIRNLARIILIYWIPIINGKSGLHDKIANTQINKNALQHTI